MSEKDFVNHIRGHINKYKDILKYYKENVELLGGEYSYSPFKLKKNLKEWWVNFCNKVFGYHLNKMESKMGKYGTWGGHQSIMYWTHYSDLEHHIFRIKDRWNAGYRAEAVAYHKPKNEVKLDDYFIKEIHLIKDESFVNVCLELERMGYDLEYPLELYSDESQSKIEKGLKKG